MLVYGATGAIGSAAVQLAKSLGASVTAVCGTAHVELVRGLGADRVVDYQTTDFTADDQRYDFVFDSVGKTNFATCRRLLKPGGRFASTEMGWLAQNFLLVVATRWIGDRKVIFAFPRHDKKIVEYLAGLLGSGEFSPLIDRTYPLEEIVDSYRYVETGQKLGNVIITV